VNDPIAKPFRLPCGAVLSNRICKAAMTEGLADPLLRATPRHETLYRTWSESGAALLLTGNVQVDRTDLERPGNVAIDISEQRTVSAEALERLRAWTRAGTVCGNHLWMQISHAGWQSPRYVTRAPRAPSDVQLKMLGNYARPRPLAEVEILDFINRFAGAAAVARETGFTGVQIHGAHGYLLSSFLSPATNRRTDAWGGPLANRARFLLEVVRAVRRAVGPDYPVALKLNSDDFRKGGFTNAECVQVVRWLNDESLDLLELSGGTYEQPRLIGAEGRADSAVAMRPSTRAREAYFLEYAAAIREVARMPLMVTGGFRTRAGMEAALVAEECDMIGMGRPFCWQPDFPRRLLDRAIEGVERIENRLHIRARGFLSPGSRIVPIKMLNTFGAMSWFYCQIFRLAGGKAPDIDRGILSTLREYLADEIATARRMHAAYDD
jgi:2,4-dienoyl-CoA reductase-like NADH-dependent reductase (Old Yellow Enzyme family)